MHLYPEQPCQICFGQAPSHSPSLGAGAAIQPLRWGLGKTLPRILLNGHSPAPSDCALPGGRACHPPSCPPATCLLVQKVLIIAKCGTSAPPQQTAHSEGLTQKLSCRSLWGCQTQPLSRVGWALDGAGSDSQRGGWLPVRAAVPSTGDDAASTPHADSGKQDTEKRTLDGSMTTVGTKLRKMWLQSVRTVLLLKATSSSSIASRSSRSPSFCRYSKEASCGAPGGSGAARATPAPEMHPTSARAPGGPGAALPW